MKIETFNQLINKKSGGSAYLKARKVQIEFAPGGKVYSYTGSVYSVAERLDLIPDENIDTLSNDVIKVLKRGESIIASTGCMDTIRNRYGDVVMENYTEDEYGRPVCTYRNPTEKELEALRAWL